MFDTQQQAIEQVQANVAERERHLEEARMRVRGLKPLVDTVGQRFRDAVNERLTASEHALAKWAEQLEPTHQQWSRSAVETWRVQRSADTGQIRVGGFREARSGTLLPVAWSYPLIGEGKTIIIRSRGEDQYAAALALLQSLVVRTAMMLPQQSRHTLLDPAGNGLAFPMARHLPRVSPSSGDTRRDLDAVAQDMTRVISTYLDAGTTSFEQIPDEMRLNEAFHFVCAADFPNRYDLRAAESLQNIAETGSRAGIYTIIHLNEDRWEEARSDFGQYLPSNAVVIDIGDTHVTSEGLAGSLQFDEAPPAELQEIIFERIKNAPPLDRPIPWDDLNDATPDGRWSENAAEKIVATVGRHGANQPLDLWFGYDDRDMRPCVHGVLGATSGAGKSTLLHALILSLASRYRPDDFRVYLIDGKFGVEFRPYQHLPHAEVVSLRTSPELARSVLRELAELTASRNEVFQRHGVVDLVAYRRLGSPDGPMPRVLLVVDEYQQLFDGDKDNAASSVLKRLSEQGRSAGIHMLLASQRFDASGMIDRDAIFNNIHLRVAMQLSQSEVASLAEFGPRGRRLIAATCDRVGRLVVNDRVGDDDHNIPGKAALLPSERRDEVIADLIDAAASLPADALPDRVIFNGQAQPNLIENPFVSGLLEHRSADPEGFEEFARQPVNRGGLGIVDWLAAERPLALFFGQEFNVRGHSLAVLRRRPTEHIAMLGERHQERVAMLAAAMATVAAASDPSQVRYTVIDRSVPRTAWASTLADTCTVLREQGFNAEFERDEHGVEAALNSLETEVERRLQLDEERRVDEPSVLVFINEPDRVQALQRVPDDYGSIDSEAGQTLRSILARGAGVGVHVVLASTSLGVLKSVIDERALQNDCRHRITLQMSEDDSFAFVRSSRASTLQTDGPEPVNAIRFDAQRQTEARFKPYSIEPPKDAGDRATHVPFAEQIRTAVSGVPA